MFDIDENHHIHRTQHGDPEAFTLLVVKYQRYIYNRILENVKNTEIAKDLTQETSIKAFCAVHTFRGASAFLPGSTALPKTSVLIIFENRRKNTPLNRCTLSRKTVSPTRIPLRAETSNARSSERLSEMPLHILHPSADRCFVSITPSNSRSKRLHSG